MLKIYKQNSGFTLLEILLVVAAIAILAGIVILAINPGKQLADTRNAQRRVDVVTISDAVYQYALDNKGVIPNTISITDTEICKTDGSCSGLVDLSVLTLNGKYLVSMPIDPSGGTTDSTGYSIYKDANGRIIVSAGAAENSAVISVSR